MAKKFVPAFPYSTPVELLIPVSSSSKGVLKKTYPDDGIRLNVSWKTYGGTETTVNDAYAVIDTANVETWYRPDIKSDCRIKLLQTGEIFEILGKPENVDMRNQFCKFKVQAVEGGA